MPCKCLTRCRKQIYRTQVQRIHAKEYPYKIPKLTEKSIKKNRANRKTRFHQVHYCTAFISHSETSLVKLRSSIKNISTRKRSTQSSHSKDCSEDFTALMELDSQKFDSTAGESSQTLMEKRGLGGNQLARS